MQFGYTPISNFTTPFNNKGTETETLKTAYGIDTPYRELDFMRLVVHRSGK